VVAAELGLALEALEAVSERDETATALRAGDLPEEDEEAPETAEGITVS
jgi:hypothetical protein